MLTKTFYLLNFFSMLNSSTQYSSYGPGFGATGHFLSSVVGQRKRRGGANAPPVYGIKKRLEI
jgi:hypothetical protein